MSKASEQTFEWATSAPLVKHPLMYLIRAYFFF